MSSVTFQGALAGQNTAARWLTVDSEGSAKLTLEVDGSQLDQILELRHAVRRPLTVAIGWDDGVTS